MSIEALILLIGTACIAVLFRLGDPFNIDAMSRAMRTAGAARVPLKQQASEAQRTTPDENNIRRRNPRVISAARHH